MACFSASFVEVVWPREDNFAPEDLNNDTGLCIGAISAVHKDLSQGRSASDNIQEGRLWSSDQHTTSQATQVNSVSSFMVSIAEHSPEGELSMGRAWHGQDCLHWGEYVLLLTTVFWGRVWRPSLVHPRPCVRCPLVSRVSSAAFSSSCNFKWPMLYFWNPRM